MELKVKLLDEMCKPFKKYKFDAGLDLKARIPKTISLGQTSVTKIPVGICVEIPEGYMGEIRPRSGLSSQGITVANGTIDTGYTGEVSVVMINHTIRPFHLNPYERVAQLVLVPIGVVENIIYVDKLDETDRGDGGFGSTGIK